MLLICVEDLLDEGGDGLKRVSIACGMIAFYFIYGGFIKPSHARKDE
nr:hypothetical protein [Candidatus Sigynarchaeota archaeon]